jgi:hypothetical protein
MGSILRAMTWGTVFWLAGQAMPAVAQIQSEKPPTVDAASLSNPNIEINYVEPRSPAFRPIYERLKKRGVLEELRAFLAPLKLPTKLEIRTDECGAMRKPYQSGGPVTICYDYIASVERAAPEAWVPIGRIAFVRQYAIAGAFIHVALHEVALAAFDILEIPVLGIEEHAADRVAGLVMLQFGPSVAYKTLMGTAWFLAQNSYSGTGMFSTARGRDLDAQRFYNYLCVAYGGDPKLFSFLKTELQERAQSCPFEFQQLLYSFNKTFMPYIDRDLMMKVRAVEWLKAEDGK